ncbi:MAG: hypothetical protein LBD22_06245 [Spirochaetaceae bacterium]|jgi:hypothetical protein|nr:hypothetical protein [Spirochaetaceae bacterium]
MRKLLILCGCLFVSAGFASAQTRSQAISLDEVFKILDTNFEKFEWVHQLLADKTEDSRQNAIKMNRLSYDITLEEKGEELVKQGEVVYIEIIRAGYRYDMKFDFSPKREKGAERANTVRNRIYGKLLVDILPSKPADSSAQ